MIAQRRMGVSTKYYNNNEGIYRVCKASSAASGTIRTVEGADRMLRVILAVSKNNNMDYLNNT